jgi:hypothetical protein
VREFNADHISERIIFNQPEKAASGAFSFVPCNFYGNKAVPFTCTIEYNCNVGFHRHISDLPSYLSAMPDTNQTCIVTRNVVENDFEIVQFVHTKAAINDQLTSWLFLHGDEEGDFLDDPKQLEFMPLSRVLLRHPLIRKYLDTPVGGNFTIDQETRRVFDWTEQRSLSLDRRVSVPTAAMVHFDILRWVRLFPFDTMTAFFALFALGLAIIHHPAWLLVTIYFSLLALVKFIRIKEHFKFGEARPSVVVSTRPLLIATEAEFYWKEKKRRFVKISKINRRAFEPLQVFEGAMLTSAVLFKQPKWYDYPPKFILAPLPVNYATIDIEEIKRTSDNLLPSYRQSLEESLTHVQNLRKVGTYEIPPDEAAKEPNDPCYCGSGKKFKKCHGARI